MVGAMVDRRGYDEQRLGAKHTARWLGMRRRS
jgi:hypothetical protein